MTEPKANQVKTKHDFVQCKRCACAADGGHDYLSRSTINGERFIELSESLKVTLEEMDGCDR